MNKVERRKLIGYKKSMIDVARHIERYPEHYNQESFACGTTKCIAGTAACQSGWKFTPEAIAYGEFFGDVIKGKGDSYEKGNAHNIAQKKFGLNEIQANWLFSQSWNPDLLVIQEEFTVPQALRLLANGIGWPESIGTPNWCIQACLV